MTNEMTKHYNQINKSVSPVACVLNNFYAVLEENYWHRVQCIDFNNETGIATVFFIDEGYEEQYKSDDLHSLDKKFCILPRQVTHLVEPYISLIVFDIYLVTFLSYTGY